MASQRITIAKLAGVAGEIALQRVSAWASARSAVDRDSWSPEQWPDQVRREADEFAERLRENGHTLPVCHFVEWFDRWSAGDLFSHWFTSPQLAKPICVQANRFEIYAYGLPDDGRLVKRLANAGPQQVAEAKWFISRLLEAVRSWEKLVPKATLVVLRQVVEGTTLDEEVTACLKKCPEWLF